LLAKLRENWHILDSKAQRRSHVVYSPEFVRAAKHCLPDHQELNQAIAWGHSDRVVELITDALNWYLIVESSLDIIMDDDLARKDKLFANKIRREHRNVTRKIHRVNKLLIKFAYEPKHSVCHCQPIGVH
jgi:hypothetical protein